MADSRLRVLIAGGGVAALEALLGLHAMARERVSVELLTLRSRLFDRPASVLQPFGGPPPASFDLQAIASEMGARMHPGELDAVDAPGHEVRTRAGERIGYDALVVAVGADPHEALRGALTFRGSRDVARFRLLLADIHVGRVRRVAFAVPFGATWTLPLYELALMTAARIRALGVRYVRVVLTTPEDSPLALFGPAASQTTAALLEEAGVEVITGAYPAQVEPGRLQFVPHQVVEADRVVSLPRLEGPNIPGLPRDDHGFIPTDPTGQVRGVEDVFAAGDATTFPVKQGGLAAQQADAVAEAIAARAGAPVDPLPFRPVLRGMLLTGHARRYLYADIAGGAGETSQMSEIALWWPPTKVSGRHIGRYLADARALAERLDVGDGMAVEADLSSVLQPVEPAASRLWLGSVQ